MLHLAENTFHLAEANNPWAPDSGAPDLWAPGPRAIIYNPMVSYPWSPIHGPLFMVSHPWYPIHGIKHMCTYQMWSSATRV